MPTKSFIVLIVVLMIAAMLFVELASMPGDVARRRKHPQAKAINILGWIGLLLGVAPWLVALIWSNLDPLTLTKDIDAPDDLNTKPDDDGAATK